MELESNELSERPVDLGFTNTLAKAGLARREDVSKGNLMYRWADIRDTVRMDKGKVRNAFSRLCSIMCIGIKDTDAGRGIRGVTQPTAFWEPRARRELKPQFRVIEEEGDNIIKMLSKMKTTEYTKSKTEKMVTKATTAKTVRKKGEKKAKTETELEILSGPTRIGRGREYTVRESGTVRREWEENIPQIRLVEYLGKQWEQSRYNWNDEGKTYEWDPPKKREPKKRMTTQELEWVQIDMHECNPDKDLNMDIYPNDKRSALIRITQI